MKKKILITGANGFIGKLLCQSFTNEREVSLYSERFDVTDLESTQEVISKFQPNLVYHLASPTDVEKCEREPDFAETTIFKGTANVLQALPKGCHFVFASSMLVYEEPKSGNHVITEDSKLNPTTNYGRAKLKAEKLIESGQTRSVILRIFPHTHKSQGSHRFLGRIFKAFGEQDSVVLEKSLLAQARDIGAGKDLVRCLHSLAFKDLSGVYNVCSGHPRNLGALAKSMALKLNKQVSFEGEKGVENSYCGDFRKLSRSLGWQPTVVSDDELISYYLSGAAL